MKGFFSFDNPIMSGLSKLAKCIYLNLLFLVCCVPIFTIGAALSAFYFTVEKSIRNDRGYIAREFFGAFKKNFKQTVPITLVCLVILAVFISDIWIMQEILAIGYAIGNMYVLFNVLIVLLLLYAFWIFAYIAKFEKKTKGVLKNTAILSVRHLLTTFLLLLDFLFAGVVIYLLPPAILLMPVISVWFASVWLERVFEKYPAVS